MADQANKPDPVGQAAAVSIGIGRIALGLGICGFTRPALDLIGFGKASPKTVAVARLAGIRDIALGLHAVSSAGDRERLREATLIGTAVDAGDAIAFGAALAGREGIDRTALMNAPAGAAAAIAGVWVLSRL